MGKKLLPQIVSACLGLWIATLVVNDVRVKTYSNSNFFGFSLTAEWQVILVLGIILGLLNYFLKPLLRSLTLPLQIVTFGFFMIIIDMFFIWFLDILFDELQAPFFFPLLYTTLIIWISNIIINFFFAKIR